MLHVFLQASPDIVDKILAQPGDAVTPKILLAVLMFIIAAIGGFLAYVYYKHAQANEKQMESSAKQTDAILNVVKAFPDAIYGIKEAMLVSHNNVKDIMQVNHHELKETMEIVKDQIIDEVRDQKLKHALDKLKK